MPAASTARSRHVAGFVMFYALWNQRLADAVASCFSPVFQRVMQLPDFKALVGSANERRFYAVDDDADAFMIGALWRHAGRTAVAGFRG